MSHLYLQPMPRSYVKKEATKFFLGTNTEIILSSQCNSQDLESALLLQQQLHELIGFRLSVTKCFERNYSTPSIRFIKVDGLEEEAYDLIIEETYIEIKATTSKGLFYGTQTLLQIIKNEGLELSGVEIKDCPYFRNRGFYHDVTRGKVPTLETLKSLVDKLAHYKINQLQLYIEHSFAFTGFSEIWYDKDPLTAEEILLLDDYCQKRHVELVPSFALFGHLYEVLRSESYKHLCELDDESEFSFYDRMAHHTLDVSNEASLELVEKMMADVLPLFSSKKFNIGCDETFDLGKGKSHHLLNTLNDGELYVEFLNKIIQIAKNHDKDVLFWGDVVLRYEHLLSKIESHPTCLNWNYDYLVEETDTKKIAKSGMPQYVCPGVAGWNHLMNLMNKGYENIRRMVTYAVKYEAEGVLTTDWGDYGHLNLFANSMPLMIYAAATSWNPLDERSKDEHFKAISLLEYRDQSCRIVSLLADLSECQQMTWYEIVKWKEKFNTPMRDIIIEEYTRFNPQQIREDVLKAQEIYRKINTYLPKIKSENQLDFREFLISTQGIELLNDFSLYLLRHEFNREDADPVSEANNLALKIERWFYEYQIIWRERNKESELIRISEVIKYLCKFLRRI